MKYNMKSQYFEYDKYELIFFEVKKVYDIGDIGRQLSECILVQYVGYTGSEHICNMFVTF